MQNSPLDKKDRTLLSFIYHDGRAMISKIARKTGLRRDSIKYRLKKLKDQKIIRSTSTQINYHKIGYHTLYKVQINIKRFDAKKEKQFVSYLAKYPSIVYLESTTGRFDFTIVMATKHAQDFYVMLREIRMKFPNILKDHEISTINQIIKFWDYSDFLEHEIKCDHKDEV